MYVATTLPAFCAGSGNQVPPPAEKDDGTTAAVVCCARTNDVDVRSFGFSLTQPSSHDNITPNDGDNRTSLETSRKLAT